MVGISQYQGIAVHLATVICDVNANMVAAWVNSNVLVSVGEVTGR